MSATEPRSFAGLRRRAGRGYVAVMSKRGAKSYLHVTETGIERRPFSGLTLDDLQLMVGDGSGQCRLGLTYRYFANPVLLIANDDAFAHTDLPVTAVINEVEFQGAFVILDERSVDPDARRCRVTRSSTASPSASASRCSRGSSPLPVTPPCATGSRRSPVAWAFRLRWLPHLNLEVISSGMSA